MVGYRLRDMATAKENRSLLLALAMLQHPISYDNGHECEVELSRSVCGKSRVSGPRRRPSYLMPACTSTHRVSLPCAGRPPPQEAGPCQRGPRAAPVRLRERHPVPPEPGQGLGHLREHAVLPLAGGAASSHRSSTMCSLDPRPLSLEHCTRSSPAWVLLAACCWADALHSGAARIARAVSGMRGANRSAGGAYRLHLVKMPCLAAQLRARGSMPVASLTTAIWLDQILANLLCSWSTPRRHLGTL